MSVYTTASGTAYVIGRSGRYAYPKLGPAGFPRDLWGPEAAQARGQLVDRDLDRSDYRVRGAGPEWLAVYEHLRSLPAALA